MVSDRLPHTRMDPICLSQEGSTISKLFVSFPTTNVHNYVKQTDAQTLISILTEKGLCTKCLIKLRQKIECQSFVLFTQAVKQLMKKKIDMLPEILLTFLN